MRSLLLGLTMIAGIPGVVHADIMSSGAAYGGSTQAVAVCYIFNGGTTNLTVTKSTSSKSRSGRSSRWSLRTATVVCSRLVASVARCPTQQHQRRGVPGHAVAEGDRARSDGDQNFGQRPEQPGPALAEGLASS